MDTLAVGSGSPTGSCERRDAAIGVHVVKRRAFFRECSRSSHARIGGSRCSGGESIGIQDGVAVALFSQEPLPVLGEVLIDGVAGDERIEARRLARLLGA